MSPLIWTWIAFGLIYVITAVNVGRLFYVFYHKEIGGDHKEFDVFLSMYGAMIWPVSLFILVRDWNKSKKGKL